MTKETFLITRDNTKLLLKQDSPENPKAVIIIVHGLCEHLGRYDYLAKRLWTQNFSVYRFDHRGHGRSEGKNVFYDNYNILTDDVYEIVEAVTENNTGLPVYLIGHSMGGLAVTSFGAKYPGKVAGIVTSGALTRNNAQFAKDLPKDLPVDTYLPNELGAGVCSDPAVVEAYKKDPLVRKEISAGLIYQLLAGVEWLKDNSSKFTDPVFLLHGLEDGLVSEKDSRDFFDAISSKDKSLKIYANLYHEILNEPCKDEIITEFINWLENRLA